MRISIVYNFFPHYRQAVLQCLHASSLDVSFISDTRSDAIEKSINTYVPPQDFEAIRVLRLFGKLYWLKGLVSAIRKQRPSKVVFLGDVNCLNLWLLCPVLRICGIEVLFWAHGWLNSKEPWLKSKFRILFLRLANRILVYGRRARALITNQSFDPRRIHVVYNSLDYESQRLTRDSISYEESRQFLGERIGKPLESKRVVLCSARLTSLKRFDLVVQAVAKIPNDRPLIVFVGDGPVRSELSELAQSLDVECYFLGACYDENVLARVFTASSVVVSPGNVGLTAMHAMAYGLPAISHSDFDRQMPEVEAIVPGVTGYLYSWNCADGLAATLVQHFGKSNEEVAAMRLACIAMIETFFNAKNQVRKMVAALEGSPETEPLCEQISQAELSSYSQFEPHRSASKANFQTV
jgi:glycosyltransferase involved in cell wall biosynthesis